MLRRTRARSEDGLAAVELGLVTTMLAPLMMGVLFWGNYFWQAQKVPPYAPHLAATDIIAGQHDCQQLLDAVASAVASNANVVAGNNMPDLGADDVTTELVQDTVTDTTDAVPDLGATVKVKVKVPVVKQFNSLLPNDGAVVTEALLRLEDVTVTTDTCR